MTDFSPAELREWGHHVESVLRGLAHSMNNRAAALSAVIELSSDPDDDPEATREILQSEMSQVQALVKTVRGIGAPREGAEALAPADLVPEVTGIVSLHADLRDRGVTIEATEAPPVRVERWMLVRALVAFIATRDAPQGERTIAVTMTGDGDWMVVRSSGGGAPSAYAGALARRMGGEPVDGGFRIPTLESIRRREAH